MAMNCTECGKSFSLPEAPHGTEQKKKKRNPRKSLTFSLLGGGVATPAVFMIFNYFSSGQILFLFYGSVILLSSVATLAVNARDVSIPVKKVGM